MPVSSVPLFPVAFRSTLTIPWNKNKKYVFLREQFFNRNFDFEFCHQLFMKKIPFSQSCLHVDRCLLYSRLRYSLTSSVVYRNSKCTKMVGFHFSNLKVPWKVYWFLFSTGGVKPFDPCCCFGYLRIDSRQRYTSILNTAKSTNGRFEKLFKFNFFSAK